MFKLFKENIDIIDTRELKIFDFKAYRHFITYQTYYGRPDFAKIYLGDKDYSDSEKVNIFSNLIFIKTFQKVFYDLYKNTANNTEINDEKLNLFENKLISDLNYFFVRERFINGTLEKRDIENENYIPFFREFFNLLKKFSAKNIQENSEKLIDIVSYLNADKNNLDLFRETLIKNFIYSNNFDDNQFESISFLRNVKLDHGFFIKNFDSKKFIQKMIKGFNENFKNKEDIFIFNVIKLNNLFITIAAIKKSSYRKNKYTFYVFNPLKKLYILEIKKIDIMETALVKILKNSLDPDQDYLSDDEKNKYQNNNISYSFLSFTNYIMPIKTIQQNKAKKRGYDRYLNIYLLSDDQTIENQSKEEIKNLIKKDKIKNSKIVVFNKIDNSNYVYNSLIHKNFLPDKGSVHVALTPNDFNCTSESFQNLIQWISNSTKKSKIRFDSHGGDDGYLYQKYSKLDSKQFAKWLVNNGLQKNVLNSEGNYLFGLKTIALLVCQPAVFNKHKAAFDKEKNTFIAAENSIIHNITNYLSQNNFKGIEVTGVSEIAYLGSEMNIELKKLKLPKATNTKYNIDFFSLKNGKYIIDDLEYEDFEKYRKKNKRNEKIAKDFINSLANVKDDTLNFKKIIVNNKLRYLLPIHWESTTDAISFQTFIKIPSDKYDVHDFFISDYHILSLRLPDDSKEYAETIIIPDRWFFDKTDMTMQAPLGFISGIDPQTKRYYVEEREANGFSTSTFVKAKHTNLKIRNFT